MKKILLLQIAMFLILSTFCQEDKGVNYNDQSTIHEVQRNSFSVDYSIVFLSALYERTFPLGNKTGIIGGGGISQGVAFTSATNPVLKANFLYGRIKHFLEVGIIAAPLGNDVSVLNPFVAYRYQSQGGFFLRLGITIVSDKDTESDTGEESTDIFPAPGITLGYSF